MSEQTVSSRALRILRLQLTLPPYPGGMEKHVRRLTDEQRLAGHQVVLVFADGKATHPEDILLPYGVDVSRVRPQSLRSALFLLAVLSLVRRRGEEFDVVHAHGDWSMAICARLVARAIGAKLVVVSVHGRVGRSATQRVLQRFAFRCADLIHATGKGDSDRLEHITGRPSFWQPSGIGSEFMASQPGSAESHSMDVFTVAVVAVLRKAKNVDLVIDIAKLMPEIRFLVGGDGPERGVLLARMTAERVKNVRMLGELNTEGVINLYRSSHVYLCTSLEEGTPTAMMEAMACGLPVVTSACNDLTEIVHEGRTGYVVAGYRAQDYVAKIEQLSRCARLRQQMAAANRHQAASFNWPSVAGKVSDAIASAFYGAQGGAR